jgi:hypothetical protein
MLLTPIPWAGCVWALPFLTILAPSERYAQKQGRRHKKLTDWGRQALLQTARWLPDRRVVAVADSSFSVIELMIPIEVGHAFRREAGHCSGMKPAIIPR